MEKIIWWWNIVYYFCMKWDIAFGNIVTYPLYKLFNTNLLRNWSFKIRAVEYDEKIIKDAVKQAQIAETYTELFLSTLLSFPVIGVVWIIDNLLNIYGVTNGSTFFFILLTRKFSVTITWFSLINLLLIF